MSLEKRVRETNGLWLVPTADTRREAMLRECGRPMRMLDEDCEIPKDRADKAKWEREHKSAKYLSMIDDAISRAKHFKATGRW